MKTKSNKIQSRNNTLLSLGVLVKRHLKLYMKDKMVVFFSVLAPIIVLLLYILFLGDMQVNSIMSQVSEKFGEGVDIEQVRSLANIMINNWMISGVMGVSCITVAFNANAIMVRDRERGNINDMLSSPIKTWVIYASYIISCFIITIVISFIVLFLSMIYLACSGSFFLSASDFFAIVGITILSVISASFALVLIISFFKSDAALASFNSIFTTVIGFLIGAYLPVSMLPAPIRYLTCFIPGTYSAGLYRNFFLRAPKEAMLGVLDDEFVHSLMGEFSVEMEFFGMRINAGWMVFTLFLSILLFGGILIALYSKKKSAFFLIPKKIKKRKK